MIQGIFDLQVNGYGGIDFNSDNLSAEQLHHACVKLQKDGVSHILATIITEHLTTMQERLQRIVKLRERDPLVSQMIVGFHIEGPFISPCEGYRGAHPQDAIEPANVDRMKRLLDAAAGLTRLVTLAPEHDANLKTTTYLAKHNIRVSAGHCDPTLDQLKAAVDAGLSLFTHLGNGCPAQLSRHDNIIQRALSLSENLWICFIADGVHIPTFSLSNYLRCVGIERCIIVTDAIAPAGLGPGSYTLSRWSLNIGEDLAARNVEGNHLVGSAISMPRVIQNLKNDLNLSASEIKQLISHNPMKAVPINLNR